MAWTIIARAAAVAAVLTSSSAAFSQGIPDTVAEWNLLGTWALDCSQAASATRAHFIYVKRGNDIFLERNFGDRRDSNLITSASISADGVLQLRIEFKIPPGIRVNDIVKAPDGRIRVVSNYDTKGAYSVKDGKLLGNGVEMPWLNHCARTGD